jgi:hypothetical protein
VLVLTRKADPEVAALVQLTNLCQGFHALPEQGGILDQDCVLMRAMHSCVIVMEKKQKIDSDKQMAEMKNAAKH